MDAYRALEERHRRMSALAGAQGVLLWDRSTMMPAGGAAARAEQLATLSVLLQGLRTEPALGDLLERAEGGADALDPWQRANLRGMRRAWRHASAVPATLVEKLSRASSAAEMRWRRARAESDFAGLAGPLRELVTLVREKAAAKGEAFGCDPYDALLDAFDPGRRAREIDLLFGRLEAVLPDLLEAVLERQAREPAALPPGGPFPDPAQHALGRRLMEVLGFDFAHGRLDVSHHPFTGGVPDDVRITTRYQQDDFTSSVMAVIHETGHAQYERGLPAAWRGQPVGDSLGMTIHESQSLLFEMQAGRSDAFLGFAAPIFAEAFGGGGDAWTARNLIRLQRQVKRGFIRVEADEVTYPLHVLLRYRLERDLVSGALAVEALPAAWNEGMKALLGVTPPDDARGVLQDIHWPGGAFGYFPTYTLGNLYAAQLAEAAEAELGGIERAIAEGRFGAILGFMRERVHRHGARMPTAELMRRATGVELGSDALIAHLERSYTGAG